MGTFWFYLKNRVVMLAIEHHVWAMELRVHISRLLVLHLDINQWKHNQFTTLDDKFVISPFALGNFQQGSFAGVPQSEVTN